MKRWERVRALGLAGALAAMAVSCGPNMRGLEEGERARIADVVDGDTLVLEGGLRVTLTGIEAPFGQEPYGRQARDQLSNLARGREARLGYHGLRRTPRRAPAPSASPPGATPPAAEALPVPQTDAPPQQQQQETALAQVFVRSEGGRWIWLQGAMVQRGHAFVRPRRDTAFRVEELLAAEAEARRARAGLWAERDYRVRTATAIEAEAEEYTQTRCGRGPIRLVEGVVRSVGDQADRGRVFLNFGERYNTDFTAAIYGDDIRAWSGPRFADYVGQRVRVRGHVIARGGPLICVDNPGMIEQLQPSARP